MHILACEKLVVNLLVEMPRCDERRSSHLLCIQPESHASGRVLTLRDGPLVDVRISFTATMINARVLTWYCFRLEAWAVC
jgi:hypothetical protein